MVRAEFVIALFCIVFGAGLQWRSRKMGATDMALLGAMLWIAGSIILMDCHWHFLTEPDH